MSAILKDLLNPGTPAGLFFFAALFFVAATVVVMLIRRMTQRVVAHLTDITAARFISALLQVLTYVVAFVLYAHVVPELRAIGTALLAGVSVVSVVIGLAAQNTLGNLIAGLSLVLYRPYSVGDQLQINSPKGVLCATVEAVTLGFTLLRDDDRQEVIVPHTVMVSTIVIRLNTTPR